MIPIHQIWADWFEPLLAAGSAIAGWYGNVAKVRMQARSDRLEAGRQALQLVADIRNSEIAARAQVTAYSAEIDTLHQRRWALDELVGELHAQAIAARLMVHDLERQLDRSPTQFDPLPVSPMAPPTGADSGAINRPSEAVEAPQNNS